VRLTALAPLFAAVLWPLCAFPQEAAAGLSVPVTVSGVAGYSRTSESGEPAYQDENVGVRAVIQPSLQLGPHWFVYSAVDMRSSAYGQYGNSPQAAAVAATLMQGYLGYKTELKTVSILIKAGRLTSAFGLYPLQYDDAKTPLIEVPLGYRMNLPLRPDQLACNLSEIYWQSADDPLTFRCGGANSASYGMLPVSLYGIPAVETQVSWNRVDARLQITNSSPANPQSLLSGSQRLQWTAGGGYSFRGGLHAGVSGFRGPYLDEIVSSFLPPGKALSGFPASGIGLDLVWLHGPWSMQGEWQRFEFQVPNFSRAPGSQTAFAEVKRVLSPRIFVAVRTAVELPGKASGPSSETTARIGYAEANQELVFGYRINRFQLVKLGGNYAKRPSWSLDNGRWNSEHSFGVGLQLVTSVTALSRAFH
jgi:hypothetical protein